MQYSLKLLLLQIVDVCLRYKLDLKDRRRSQFSITCFKNRMTFVYNGSFVSREVSFAVSAASFALFLFLVSLFSRYACIISFLGISSPGFFVANGLVYDRQFSRWMKMTRYETVIGHIIWILYKKIYNLHFYYILFLLYF